MEIAATPPIAQLPIALLSTTAGAGLPAPNSAQDAAAIADEFDAPDAWDELSAVSYPPYTTAQLQDFMRRISTALPGTTEITLAAVSEPGLYTLTAALFAFANRNADPPAGRAAALIAELCRELRQRNGRAMGSDPAGPVRRGRLLQLIGSFTTLSRAGASPLQRHRISGDCPLCAGPKTLSVFLASVRWRCFACDRQGGVPEFAAAMLDTVMPAG